MTGLVHHEASIIGSVRDEQVMRAPSYHPAVGVYLSAVRKNIHGLVPRDRVERYLSETAYWILCRAKMLESDGLDEDSAVRQATAEHDEPQQLGFALVEEYFESRAEGPLVKRMGRANAIVFTVFGLATGIYFLLLQLMLAFPRTDALHGSLSPAALERFYPALLPYPELSWQFVVASLYPLVVPFLGGWVAGRLVPVRAQESVLMGMVPLVLFSCCASWLLLPDKTGVVFTVLLVVFWLPVASIIARVSSSRLRTRLNSGVAC